MAADVAREADVAHRTRTDATRHTRPHGRACEAHAACRWHGWRGHIARGHAGPRGSKWRPVRGATWQGGCHVKGPQVSGP